MIKKTWHMLHPKHTIPQAPFQQKIDQKLSGWKLNIEMPFPLCRANRFNVIKYKGMCFDPDNSGHC